MTCFYDQSHEHRLVEVTSKKVKGLKHCSNARRCGCGCGGLASDWGLWTERCACATTSRDCRWRISCWIFITSASTLEKRRPRLSARKLPAARQWLAKVLHTLRHEGYDPFFGQLLDWRAPLRGNKRQAADDLLKYVATRQEMILYEKCA